ncbi:DUF2207 domain-containing protein [Patescibacteria group bacterium]
MRSSTQKRLLSLINWIARGVVVSFIIVAAVPGQAAAATVQIDKWESKFVVQENGSVKVNEEFRIKPAGEECWLYLNIPKEYISSYGRTQIYDLQVLDEEGEEISKPDVRIKEAIDQINIAINIPGANEVVKRQIKYDIFRGVYPVLSEDSDRNQFQWKIVSGNIDVAIKNFRAEIVLPESISSNRVVATSSDSLTLTRGKDNTFIFKARDTVPFKEIVISAEWPDGAINLPDTAFISRAWHVVRYPHYASPFIVALILIYLFFRYGKDPRKKGENKVRFSPPRGISAAHLSALIYERARLTSLIAVIIDLAQKGYILVIEEPRRSAMSKKDYTFILKREFRGDPDLGAVEQYMMNSLFGSPEDEGGVDVVKLSTIKNKCSTRISSLRQTIMKDLVKQKFFREDPRSSRGKYMWIATIVVLFTIPTWIIGGIVFNNAWSGVPLLVIGGLFYFFAPLMPQKTKKGAQVSEWGHGFLQFLRHPEKHNVTLTLDVYNEYLPYALIFRVEKDWTKAFEEQLTEPPHWYSTPTSFTSDSITDFYNALHLSFIHAASQTLASRPGGRHGSIWRRDRLDSNEEGGPVGE